MSIPYHAYFGIADQAKPNITESVALATRTFARSSVAKKTGGLFASLLKLLRGPARSEASISQAYAARHQADVAMLNHMARDLDATQPALAAELRMFASRD
jgi:hypothetical protein